MLGFFDRFPEFYQTSATSPQPDRLNGRHQAIIGRNAAEIHGKRVLDIASHDGRWAFAALDAGAAHVTGVEARKELVSNAIATFQRYDIDRGRFTFHVGDVFESLQGQQFDVVLCLGFFYHTIRHVELFHRMASTNAGFIVIDSEVIPRSEEREPAEASDPRLIHNNPYCIQLLQDPSDQEQMAWHDPTTRNGQTIVGRPSRAAVRMIAGHFGYDGGTFDWGEYFLMNPSHGASMPDYKDGWRETFYFHRI